MLPGRLLDPSSDGGARGMIVVLRSAARREGGNRIRLTAHCDRFLPQPLSPRSEGEQTAVTVLHDELAGVPGRIRQASRELDTAGRKLRVERVGILDEQVGVEEFVGVLVRIRCRWLSAAEVDSVVVARDDGVDGRVLPGAETVEAKFVSVIGERRGDVDGEELRGDLADHGAHHSTHDFAGIIIVWYDSAQDSHSWPLIW